MTTNLSDPLIPGLSSVADRYDVILSDVWGVIHNGREHFPEACAALGRFRAHGGTVVMITNAPRPRRSVIRQLDHLLVPTTTYDTVVTSGDVTLALMAEHGDVPVHHIGPERDLALFHVLDEEFGVRPRRAPVEQASYILCSGLNDDHTETPDDYTEALAEMQVRDLPMICANPDIVVHVGEQLIYCAGALAHRYEDMGGAVAYAGKPHAPIYERALQLASEKHHKPVDPKRVLAIGDAFHTDIAGALAHGLDALFVSEGIHRDDLYDTEGRFDVDAYQHLARKHGQVPTAAISRLVW
ncbi:TIGR01459 family HAD-type hydrolase [Methylovirgula sp. 4M-Z18]|uniref:TIGR01459 family HAD-type hydrolase n=1 Tax=Methylovirgula sp. 4M-Z18 TaxID=2293567 RepID=UPI000E2F5D46|nr:TIGR01459 family HAD-type hydrolase [Methylovirgula sp. 4M-Z18]RFB76380.1 TIGR01459 family HAD-type hydrolase [Methylovirgula sp. 4M-Z18]